MKYVEIGMNEVERETEKAILVEGKWVAKSQLLLVYNNEFYDFSTKQVKKIKETSIYSILLPLWLQMKCNFRFKKSFEVEDYMNKINVDKRTNIKYESFKYCNYTEFDKIKKEW